MKFEDLADLTSMSAEDAALLQTLQEKLSHAQFTTVLEWASSSGVPGLPTSSVRGTQFAAADGAWLVGMSDKRATEWVVWQRAVPGDRRPHTQGYVRRVPWMRFAGEAGRAQAMFIAGVLDDLPASASLEVFRVAVRDAMRNAKTALVFRGLAHVAEAIKAMRPDPRAEDDLQREDAQ